MEREDAKRRRTQQRTQTKSHRYKFSPMAAPGPCGCRGECLAELTGNSAAGPARRLQKVFSVIQSKVDDGSLPETMRWIADSTLVFLRKPNKDTPRPIRCGSTVRKGVTKKLMDKHMTRIRQAMRTFHQYGVQCPGGTEALFHWRAGVEAAASGGTLGDLAIIDVDLANCFCTIELKAIKEGYSRFLPEFLAWENWACRKPARIRLPCGKIQC